MKAFCIHVKGDDWNEKNVPPSFAGGIFLWSTSLIDFFGLLCYNYKSNVGICMKRR